MYNSHIRFLFIYYLYFGCLLSSAPSWGTVLYFASYRTMCQTPNLALLSWLPHLFLYLLLAHKVPTPVIQQVWDEWYHIHLMLSRIWVPVKLTCSSILFCVGFQHRCRGAPLLSYNLSFFHNTLPYRFKTRRIYAYPVFFSLLLCKLSLYLLMIFAQRFESSSSHIISYRNELLSYIM